MRVLTPLFVILVATMLGLLPAVARAGDADNNDSTGTATALTPDLGKDTGTVQVVVDDADMFAIAVPASGWLSVVMSYTDAQANLNLQLIDSDGVTVLENPQRLLIDLEEVDHSASASTLYVRVVASNTPNGAASYSVWSVFSTLVSEDDHPADADRNSLSRELLNGNLVDETVDTATDTDDWYYFEVIDGGDERVAVTWSSSSDNIDLAIFEADGNTMISQSNAVNSTSELIDDTYAVGRYFIRVRAVTGTTIAYQVTLTSPTAGGGSTGVSKCGALPIAGDHSIFGWLVLIALPLLLLRRRRA